MLTHAPWTAVPGLRHAFLGREECADAADWARVVAATGVLAPVVTSRQVHGTRVVGSDQVTGETEADALVAATAGRLVGVVTADCVPVLLVDRRRRVAAAVHAGWRGTAAGVLEAAVEHLGALGAAPADLEAVLGPAVGGCCYQVGPEVRAALRARTGDLTTPACTERDGRLMLDLRAAARLLLRAAGVARVTALGPCASCDTAYYSYRRDGAGTGRQLSFVGWA